MNPFRGSVDGTWYHVALHMDDYGTIEFMVESPYFFTNTPCLMGRTRSIEQECEVCRYAIDIGVTIFVVNRIRKGVEYNFVSKIALLLDEKDIFCSIEKFPDFLKWQMEEHKKTCGKGNTVPT